MKQILQKLIEKIKRKTKKQKTKDNKTDFLHLAQALQQLVDEIPGYFKIPVDKSGTFLPPPIDDFDLTRKISWNMFTATQYWIGNVYKFFHNEPMDLEEFRDMARKDIAFILLASQHESYKYLQEALLLHEVQKREKGFLKFRIVLRTFISLWKLTYASSE